MEYPKSLYLKGWDDLSASVIVYDREAEDKARAKGYRMLNESEPVQAEPAKRGRKPKAQ